MASAELEDLFKTYDTRGTGYLSQDELRNLCAKFGISVQDADAIFHDLDHDDDGRIDYEKFSNGFTVFATQSRRQSVDPDPTSCLDEDKKQMVFQTWQNLMKELGKAGNLISEEKLLAMSTELQNSENPNLVIHFETLISDLLESIRKLQEENAKLENLWKREKKEHERHLHSSEEELDTQVKHLELREKKQVDSWLKSVKDPIKADRLSEVLTKLEDAVDENRQVRISLMDTQTSVALMRSDIAQLRSMYEEKCRELRSERERVLDVFNKHDHLSRLLFLLHDDTKRLQDTNDTLGEFVDVERNLCHKQTSHVELGKTDSIIGDYLCAEMPSIGLAKSKQSSIEENDDGYSLIEDSEDNRRLLMSWFGLNNDDNSNMDSIMDDIDSGLSTLRDVTETDDFSDNVAEENEKQAKILRLTTKKESSTSTQSQSGSRKSSLSERRHLSKPKVRTEVQSMLQSDAKVKSDILENGQPLSYSITHTESEEGFSSRRVMEIKRQLGLDPEVAGYTRQLSSKQSTPTSTVDGTPVPTPRLSLEHHPAQARKLPPHPLPRGRFKQQKAVHVVTKKSDVNKRILNQSVEVANIHEERIVHAQEENHQQQKLKAVESYSIEPKSPIDRTYKVEVANIHEERVVHAQEENHQQQKLKTVESYSIEPKSPLDRTYEVNRGDSFEPNGPQDRTYKVVFVGDAAVGKSSLIIRLSKGVFVENLTSTLGVDFYMKYLRVDGRNIAVQLWDTAGQERFRSITQSYFRKADGIMLVYDCTNEHSFLNVRQWIDAVDVSCFYTMMALHANSPTRDVASQRIPVVILANKTDQRKMAQAEKRCCVSTEDGQKLAKCHVSNRRCSGQMCGTKFERSNAKTCQF
ncbi:ras and EF-hand domain-containing protein-like isoform X3 [Limulus polyphemus]|uniref:Ras and EF-hand domain-containing protein-like isoform X3 n=1 Tax=Limulus polyphemus TaxID=6850 RepID=A0ABM1T4E2_LIMPO|nr:ras and EF-hand domain-containing protein-like isoform X3 [Limulus polyphemus]